MTAADLAEAIGSPANKLVIAKALNGDIIRRSAKVEYSDDVAWDLAPADCRFEAMRKAEVIVAAFSAQPPKRNGRRGSG